MITRIITLLYKIQLKIIGYDNHILRNSILRRFLGHIGKDCFICTNNFGAEPEWIYIEDNVIVATGVKFINHDASCWNAYRHCGLNAKKQMEKVGPIILRNNCFIGAYSILLPNITIGENSIVAAGAVVNRNIPSNQVWGGVPAHFIMTFDEYVDKMKEYYNNIKWLNVSDKELKEEQKRLFDNIFFNNVSNI